MGRFPRMLLVLAFATWCGLVTGLAELAVLAYRHLTEGASMLGALQMNRHFPWMVPVSHLAFFAAALAPAALLTAFAPRTGRRLAIVGGLALSAFALLSMIRGLHVAAAGLLAVGLACRLSPRIDARPAGLGRVVRASLPAMLGFVAAMGGWSYHREVLRERELLATLPAAGEGAPNVLLIVLDTVRADHLSAYGDDRETTPNLARLADRGVIFREARAAAPWTLPSHACLLTGRWPHELKVGPTRPLDGTFPTLAEFLADRGYSTSGFIANTYYCNSWFGLARGFIHYEDYHEENVIVSPAEALRCTALGRRLIRLVGTSYNVRPEATNTPKDAARINRDFLRWLDAERADAPDRPFFTFLNYIDAHDPYMVPPGFGRHFGLKPETAEDLQTIQGWSRFMHEHSATGKSEATPRQRELVRDAYDDCLAYLDEELGRLFDELDRRGLLDETLVIVTSDHGEQFGEHNLYGHGISLYRGEVHVPLIVAGPGIPAGRSVEEPVSLRALPTTIVDRLGHAAASPFPGRRLAPLWRGDAPAESKDDPVLSTVSIVSKPLRTPVPGRAPSLCGPVASVIVDGHTYIRDAFGREELYDLADLAECRNLADVQALQPILERGRRELDRLVPGSPEPR